MRAALYVRQSLDKTGDGLGVARQEDECRRLCEYRGWDVSEVITDNDKSASVGVRPGYLKLKQLIETRQVDVVVVLRVDRLLRKLTDLEELIELTERTGVKIATVEGDLQLDNASGRLLGRILASVARAEVETKSARQKLANRQKAESGKPHGSRRAFGYSDDGLSIVEDEALVLKDIAHKFVNGWSYRRLADYLNGEGILTSEGKLFYPITIRNMLIRKRYAGIREYEGVEYEGIWPAIYDADMWQRIQRKYRDRREQAGMRGVSKKYLLTGFLYCGACGAPLNGQTKRDNPKRPIRRTYACLTNYCVVRGAEPIEHFLRELIAYRLGSPRMDELVENARGESGLAGLLVQRDALLAKLETLLDDYTDNTLTKAEYSRAKDRVLRLLESVDGEIATRDQSQVLGSLTGASMAFRERWEIEGIGWQRQVIGLLVERVDVQVGKTKPFYLIDGKTFRFDPSLIDVVWRV